MAPFRISSPRLAYFAVEGGLILALLYGLAELTVRLVLHQGPAGPVFPTVAVIAALFSIVLVSTQSDTIGQQGSLGRELVLFAVLSLLLGGLGFVAALLALGDVLRLETLMPLEAAIAVPATITGWRLLSSRVPLLNLVRERVLIVGTGESARQVCRWITSELSSEFTVVGFADEDDARLGTIMAMGIRIHTDYASIAEFAPKRADRVIVALDEKRGKLPVLPLMELRLRGVAIDDATTFLERASGRLAVETMLPSWLIFSDGFKISPLRAAIKRAVDVLLSILLLVLSSPLIVLAAVAVAAESGFPILYRQKRVGLDGREFEVLKFRSMVQDAERDSGPTWAVRNDPRVTRVGRVIRFLRVDELPQLVNVLRGEMSFVGPRPERAHFVRQLQERIPYYGLRMIVAPGLTGWAQVQYRYAATDEDTLEKLKYDLYYIKNHNVLFDLWIVLKTIKVVLTGSGAH